MSVGTTTPSSQAQLLSIPRTLWDAIPWVYSSVLFPAKAAGNESSRWLSWLILIVLPSAILYPCMSYHLFEPDEGRYAEIPREMLARGEWVVPYLQGKPYLDKPPLLYWMVMISYVCFGVHAGAARLIPTLALHGCILLNYAFGKRYFGERAAFWGALSLFFTPYFVGVSRLLVLDGVLTLFVTLALYTAFESVRKTTLSWSWWFFSAVMSGIGVLSKGPVILVLIFPPLLTYLWLTNGLRQITMRAFVVYLGITGLVAFPWYLMMCLRVPEFAYYFFWKHNVQRFLDPFDHLQPFGFYVPIVLLGCLPATFLFFDYAKFLFSGRQEIVTKRSPELGFFLMAGLWCLLFFSMSGCKLPTYILPAFPPMALAFGSYLVSRGWSQSVWTYTGMVLVYVFLVCAHYIWIPNQAYQRSPLNTHSRILELCQDPEVSLVGYPRTVDSMAFYMKRDDIPHFRSKYTPKLLRYLNQRKKVVVFFGHRHSMKQLENLLPPKLKMVERYPLGLYNAALIVRK
ncbi:MAG: ArnT family glycosyltransferase [Gemmataceae bacterium]